MTFCFLKLSSSAAESLPLAEDISTPSRQTIQHFGASDAWSMQFIGLWDDEAEQQKIADWLFSTENDAQGQPRGIGLSVWRFNLGAGSAEQGDASQHHHLCQEIELFSNVLLPSKPSRGFCARSRNSIRGD